MSFSECCIRIDSHGQELVSHGKDGFPVSCFRHPFGDISVPWHWHPEWEVAYVSEGTCILFAGQTQYTLRAGDGFFINSGVLHSCRNGAAAKCALHSLVFLPDFVSGSPESTLHRKYVFPITRSPGLSCLLLSPDDPWQQEALAAIRSAWEAYVREAPGYEFQVRDTLSRLTLLLWQNQPPQTSAAGRQGTRDSERIKQMLAFIHRNYAAPLTMGQIAASASVSESECLRCFRGTIGSSPIRYLKQYRLRQAARQLAETQEPVAEIAASCGFQDMSYFSKSFRLQLGCTPTEYRAENRPDRRLR